MDWLQSPSCHQVGPALITPSPAFSSRVYMPQSSGHPNPSISLLLFILPGTHPFVKFLALTFSVLLPTPVTSASAAPIVTCIGQVGLDYTAVTAPKSKWLTTEVCFSLMFHIQCGILNKWFALLAGLPAVS